MAIIPQSKVEQLEFCESHWPAWTLNAAAIGVSPAQVLAFKNLTGEARIAYDAAQAAKQAYRAAITSQNAALSAAVSGTGGASDLIRVIKGFAELSGDPAPIYALAALPLPAAPTPATAPGVPNMIGVTLEPTGAVTLSWDCDNASASSGGFFNILRRLPGQTSFIPIGGAPGSTAQSRRMSYTDFTIPTSAAQTGAVYIIQGRRGTLMGEPSDAITVQFGVEGGGMFVVNGQSNALKMAA